MGIGAYTPQRVIVEGENAWLKPSARWLPVRLAWYTNALSGAPVRVGSVPWPKRRSLNRRLPLREKYIHERWAENCRMAIWPKAVRSKSMPAGSMLAAPTAAIICMNWLEPKLWTADHTREVATRTPPVVFWSVLQ